jgi:hypothetical protein
MTDLTKLLRDADPLHEDEGLSPAEALAIRRRMLAEVRPAFFAIPAWQRPLAVTAVVALMVVVGVVTGRRMSNDETVSAISPRTASIVPAGGSSAGSEMRQLQFSTPGGTRIIWIFDQNFRLQESMR